MRIGIIGGTGKEGRGLALRWARAGHDVLVGSRAAERGQAGAGELAEVLTAGGGGQQGQESGQKGQESGSTMGTISGGDNHWAVRESDVALLAVPYAAHRDTLLELRPTLAGAVLIDITVPLAPPRVREVHLPGGQAAALEAQELLGPEVRVVAALHHLSSAHLGDMDHDIDSDVLVCADDADARALAMALIEDLGVRALDAGSLQNAIALESLTPVLLHMNRRYKSRGSGLRITGI
jgi:8-hydroxy-5-deazaflavin:NADPH oxidoreductase